MQRDVDRIAAERVLATPPRQRAAREQEELREWALEKMPRELLEMATANDTAAELTAEQQRLLCGQLRGLWLAPHELLQPADVADNQMYIVLRGELRVFGNGSHVGTLGVGSSVGRLNAEEYCHTDSHYAGEDGCMLGVLDYAHSLAAQGRTMGVATRALQTEPTRRSPQDARVVHALLEDLAFFQHLSIEAEQVQCCSLLRLQLLKEGDVICREGDIGDMFFIVLRGSVEVRAEGEEGGSEHLGVGGSFGKLSLLSQAEEDRKLHSSIIAGPQCVCAILHRDEFQRAQQEAEQQLVAALAKPLLERTRADKKLVADVLRLAVAQSSAGNRLPSTMLNQIAGHATLLSLAAGETARLPGGSFVHVLEGQAVLDAGEDVHGLVQSRRDTEGRRQFFGAELLYESPAGRGGRGPGSTRESAQWVSVHAKGGICKLLVVCSTDVRHVQRRASLQPWIDTAWALCGGRLSDQINQLEWAEFWKGVLKTLTPAASFSSESALAWCAADWHDMLERAQWGAPQPSCRDDVLQHEVFSEALTCQVEEFWAISEPCPTLHAALLAELLAATTRSNGSPRQNRAAQRRVELGTVKCRSEFFMGLRNDAHQLMLRSLEPLGRRSALERIEAEIKESGFTLTEAFELEKSAPVFAANESQPHSEITAGLTVQAPGMVGDLHLSSAASATPSQWSARLDAWAHGIKTETETERVQRLAAGSAEEAEHMYSPIYAAGSVEWGTLSAENSDDDVEQFQRTSSSQFQRTGLTTTSSRFSDPPALDAVSRPPVKMTPVVMCGGPPPTNDTDVRNAIQREKLREGPAAPSPGVRLQGLPSALSQTRAPVPPKVPPPLQRRTHKEMRRYAKELYAQRHSATIQRVASEKSFGLVSQELARSGNTQSWAPKSRTLPQQIHVGNPKGRARPSQAPPDPRSIDPETGLQNNRHRTLKPTGAPRNAEQRASARAERQQLRAARAAATRTVVPGKLVPEPPRAALRPRIIGSARDATDRTTAAPEKVVRRHGVDTDRNRVYAVLPSGVPKEWVALHYKWEKALKAQKKEAAAHCAAAIARGVKVGSAYAQLKAVANKKMPFGAAIGFSQMEGVLQQGASTIAAAQPITAERWVVREESSFSSGRPPEVVPTATAYGHSGSRKPLERLAPPTPLFPWCADGRP